MELTDWLGNEYGPGDLIIYPVGAGRSIEMQQATVVDIWTVYMCPTDYKWKRLKEGQEVPTKEEGHWNHSGGKSEWVSDGHKPVKTERRVRLQPNGKGSRNFSTRADSKTTYIDSEGNEVSHEDMVRTLEAKHGPQYTKNNDLWSGWTRNWDYGDFGYKSRRDAIQPKPVTLTMGIDNITLLKKAEA